MFGLVK
jgi:hypothetical protein